ncbi:hypothetical protein J2128_000434 [Methanomicrobium sp. W14]|uniref:hypothetical protein n=1 Tax=Methanomicrobium sp. W14 TaxID=2817839 RepID=UPI001AE481EB|nr:hypothetical protein [Methanomicrobium sp. W14]MBP2132513.1 hypothetical protein [Methanomicrobium sp. W14]
MQKQDLMFFAVAIAVVIILALVVKPILSGESVLPESKPQTVSNIPIPSGAQSSPYTPVLSKVTQTPTETPAWDGAPKSIQFVDPSTYNIQWAPNLKDLGYSIPSYEEPGNNTLVTYATIDGQWDATTQIINIPFPYWEMKVSIENLGDVGNTDDSDSGEIEGFIASEGEGIGVEPENQYMIIPSINIQVMDAEDPNSIVYILNTRTEGAVPKEIDKSEGSYSNYLFSKPEDVLTGDNSTDRDGKVLDRDNVDEFVWTHKFYEGAGNYYFIINPNMLKSYKIEIEVPEKYIYLAE